MHQRRPVLPPYIDVMVSVGTSTFVTSEEAVVSAVIAPPFGDDGATFLFTFGPNRIPPALD